MTAHTSNEAARLLALRRYDILDTVPEPAFDRLVAMAARLLAVPAAAISLVDADRVWFKARVGVPVGEAERWCALCARTALQRQLYQVPDLAEDPTLVGNPLLLPPFNARFFAGVPLLTPDGFAIGTLCVMDRVPRPRLTQDQCDILVDLAEIAMTELERRRQQALQRAGSDRLALINDILASVGGTAGFLPAIEAVIARLCQHVGGMGGQLWDDMNSGAAVRIVALVGPTEVPADVRARIFAGFPVPAEQSLLAPVMASGGRLVLPSIPPALAERYPLLQRNLAEGVRSIVAQGFTVGTGRYLLTLGFPRERTDLEQVADLMGDVVQAIRPALLRTQTETRLKLLNEILACVGGAADFVSAMQQAIELLCRHVDAQYGMLWTRDGESTDINLVALSSCSGMPPDFRAQMVAQFPYPSGRSLMLAMLDEHGRVVMPNITEEMARRSRLLSFGWQYGTRSLAVQSIIVGQRFYLLSFVFGSERHDLDKVADLLVEVAQAIRPTLLRKQAQEGQALLQAAVDATADAVVIASAPATPDAEPVVVYVNPAFTRMTGYRAAEVMQGRGPMFLYGPDSDPAVLAALGTALRAGQPLRQEKLAYRRDGSPFWVELGVTPILDEHGGLANWVGVVRDISERRASQQALQRMAADLHERTVALSELARMARTGSWCWKVAEGVLEWSDEVYALFGIQRGDVALHAEWFLERLHPGDRARVRRLGALAIETGTDLKTEARVQLAGGKLRCIAWNGSCRRGPDGSVMELRGYCQDVTEQRATEAAMRHGEKLRALGELTGGIAHEFNNLLMIIQGSLEFAMGLPQSAAQTAQALEEAYHAANGATELTGRLLSFGRAQPLRTEATDLNQWLEPLLQMAVRTLGRPYRLTLCATTQLPMVAVDRSQLEGAVLNLILNARDAMPRGGKIVIETGSIDIRPDAGGALAELPPGRYATVAVRDDGPGMPPEIADRVFEPFFTTKAPGSGTGLGLSMVFNFARHSGGTALLETVPGEGTVIRMLLPMDARP